MSNSSKPTLKLKPDTRQAIERAKNAAAAVHSIVLGIAIGCCALAVTPIATAIEIVIHHNPDDDVNPPSWDDQGMLLEKTFQAAAKIWQDLLPGPGKHDVDIKWDDGFSSLGQWNPDLDPFSYNNIRINPNPITNNASSTSDWFYDPTPFDHSEFGVTEQITSGTPRTYLTGRWHFRELQSGEKTAGFYGTPPDMLEVGYGRRVDDTPGTVDSLLEGQYDLLSTVLHELGHELGINGGNLGPGWDFDSQFVGGVTGSGVRKTDLLDFSVAGHLVPRTTLMCAKCALLGVRRLPSAVDVLAVAEHHDHAEVNLERIDFIAGTDWHTPTNWIGGKIPSAMTDAFIHNPSPSNVRLSGNGDARNLLIGESNTLATLSHLLRVQDTTMIEGDGTFIFVNPGGAMNTGNLVIQDLGHLRMRGGLANITDQSLTIDNTSRLTGHGEVRLAGAESFINDGIIYAVQEGASDTLALVSPYSGVKLDLDGTTEAGHLFANDGNLRILGALKDDFDGDFRISGGRIAEFSQGWALAGEGRVFSNGDDWVATLRGDMHLKGLLITLADEDLDLRGHLRTEAGSTMKVDLNSTNWLSDSITYNGGHITGLGRVVQDADAVVLADTLIDVDTYQINRLDQYSTRIANGAILTINSNALHYSGTGYFDGDMLVDNGTLVANIANGTKDFLLRDTSGTFTDLSARLRLRDNGRGNTPRYEGSRLVLGSNGLITAERSSLGPGTAEIASPTFFQEGRVEIDPAMTLKLTGENLFGATFFAGSLGNLRLTGNAESDVRGHPVIEPRLQVDSGSTLEVFSGANLEVRNRIEVSGKLQGTGMITGQVVVPEEGVVQPGSPVGQFTIDGVYQTEGTTNIYIGSTGAFSTIDVGEAQLLPGSVLEVDLSDVYDPAVGDSYEILTADILIGEFSSAILPIMSGVSWWVDTIGTSIWLNAELAGDFNRDNIVDGRDYLSWQRGESPNPGSASDLEDWRSNYGRSSPPSTTSSVPEPASLTLMLFATYVGMLFQRRGISLEA